MQGRLHGAVMQRQRPSSDGGVGAASGWFLTGGDGEEGRGEEEEEEDCK